MLRAMPKPWMLLVLLASVCAASAARPAGRARASPGEASRANGAAASTGGQQEFETRCSGCHGLDGQGGEHAPNIATSQRLRQLPRDALLGIVRAGIPAKGMPAFGYLSADTLISIADYLQRLGGQVGGTLVQGNSTAGETLFFGKAECANCHMVHGKGGFLGPDLTDFTPTHTVQALKDAILNPRQSHQHCSEVVEVLTTRGEQVSGVVRDEDNFSLQLQARDGTFHLLMKSEIRRLDRSGSAIMPDDYGRRLTKQQLEDLLAYLRQNLHSSTTPSSVPVRSQSQTSQSARDRRR